MAEPVLHPLTAAAIDRQLRSPAQAVVLHGPAGSGKATLALLLAQQILGLTPEADIQNQPYLKLLDSPDGKAISIEAVRTIQHFLQLAIPGKQGSVRRAVIIDGAQLLGIEAQNALLKTLEEPPADTVIIMTTDSLEALLPTIRSRVTELAVRPPLASLLKSHFASQGHADATIDQALLLSGGLPGLAAALLAHESTHPLTEAVVLARSILQSKAYDRLLLIDGLSKQKPLCLAVIAVLKRMARLSLLKAAPLQAQRWQTILEASHSAERQLLGNTQAKLVMANLFLAI